MVLTETLPALAIKFMLAYDFYQEIYLVENHNSAEGNSHLAL